MIKEWQDLKFPDYFRQYSFISAGNCLIKLTLILVNQAEFQFERQVFTTAKAMVTKTVPKIERQYDFSPVCL